MSRVAALILLIATVAIGVHAQDDRRWAARLAEGFAAATAGRVDEAQAIFDDVAALARDAHDDRSLAEARRGQARIFAAKGDAAATEASFAEALSLFEGASDVRGAGQVHSDRGFFAWQKGDFAAAQSHYTRAADIFERAGLKAEHAGALRNMTFGTMPATEKAAILERALAIAVESPDRRLEGLILHALGDTQSGLGNQQAALDRYQQALPLLERAGDPAILARLLTSFGRLYRIHGDPSSALRYYERTIELVKPTTDRDAERQAEDALSIAFGAMDRARDALAHAERALALAIEFRPALVLSQQLRVAEFALRANDLDRAMALLNIPQRTPANEAMRRAARAIALAKRGDPDAALIEADAAVSATAPLTWEERIRAYNARSIVHEIGGRLPDAAADAAAAVDVLEAARGTLVVSDAFRAAFSDGYRAFYDRAIILQERIGHGEEAYRTAESGRARALLDLIGSRPSAKQGVPIAAGEALIAYWVTRDATYAWVVNSSGVTTTRRIAVTRSALDTLVSTSQAGSKAVDGSTTRRGPAAAVFDRDPRPSLRRIYAALFSPLRASLGSSRRVMIVPDGPLLGMSFAELIDPRGRYLVEDFTLQYAPSAQLFNTPREPTTVHDSALLVSVSSGHAKSAGISLDALPGVTREVNAITPLFQRGTATRLSDNDATEANVRAAIANRRVVHFATHAIASSTDPSQSFLALRPGAGDDGRLTANEILSMRLDADLVVLSACRGAAGRVSGEGMLGLSRALLGAGAHALLASVREVPDETAAEMLPAFYRSWRVSGDAAAALRSAQLAQLRRLRSGQVRMSTPFGPVTMPEHPSLWSGLVLIGER